MIFAHVAGCWVSGQVTNEIDSVLTIRLVTGTTIHRQKGEVRDTSPRLDDHTVWPL